MYNFLTCNGCQGGRAIAKRINLRFMTKITEPLGAVEPKEKRLEFVTENVIHDSMGTGSTTIPLIEQTGSNVSHKICDIPVTRMSERVKLEMSSHGFEEIPGPAVLKIWEKYWKYVPIIGRLTWSRNFKPLKYLFNEYGPIVRINGPMIGDVVMIHRPDHIAKILDQEGDNPMRIGIDVLWHYFVNHRKYQLSGAYSMQGTEFPETRAKLEKPLAEQISRHFSRLDVICNDFAQRVRKIRNRRDQVPESFDKELSRWGMECFSVLMFNKRLGFLDPNGFNSSSEPARIIDALTKAHLYLGKCESGFQFWRFLETPYSRKLFEACDVIDGLVGKHIRNARNQLTIKSSTNRENSENSRDEGSSLLETLLMNEQMRPYDVSVLLMDMIILGVQATVNTQAFLLYFLAKNPRIQRKLYEEISLFLPTRESSLSKESLERMTYLKACLRECLRLRPPYPYISRIMPDTITLNGYTIPKGTCLIMANEISSQRDENFDDPDKFRPERWLGELSTDNTWEKFSCLPFGHGIRSCVGKRIARTKIMLLTAKLIREFKIEYDYGDIASKYSIINVPNRPLRFNFVKRH